MENLINNNIKSARSALLSIVSGSKMLASQINHEAFKKQEKKIFLPLAFLWEIFSEYPRMTKRIIQLDKFDKQVSKNPNN